MMDDIEILKLENKGLRCQNKALTDEIRILRRYRQIIERSSALVDNMPSAVEVNEPSPMPLGSEDDPLLTMLAE